MIIIKKRMAVLLVTLEHRVTNTRTYEKPTRPTFIRAEPEDEVDSEAGDDVVFGDYIMAMHDEWDRLPQRVKDHLNFDSYISQKRDHNRNWNNQKPWNKTNDLKYAINNLTLSTFDGSGRVTTRAWISKLDTFLTLRPMSEEDAIRFAALHLDGVAHDWWYHGMVTLHHDLITTYQ